MAASQTEWERMQQLGFQRFLLRGALRHGIPMAAVVVLLLEVISGTTPSRDRLVSGEFLSRVLLCLAVFTASGAISSLARWKAAESLFGKRDGT
ncbi:MAG: hypothetical protein H6Q91_1533 [Deltaproteobacteria bacterium]|nr:hypothetical protein [Deltaproteobacteria bacterium]